MKILFVCKGNAGRSQIAIGLFNSLSKKHKAVSSGTVAKSAGQKMSERSPQNVQMMKEIGIDISNQKCKKLTKKMADSADKIIVLCRKNSWPPYLLKSGKVTYWKTKETKIRLIRKWKKQCG